MSESFVCGDTGALVAYLYDECEPEVREAVSAHLIQCVSCASEAEGLGWTRRQLAAWAPPFSRLGFQMPTAAVERSQPWWRAPLPAWAQAAAALLVFGAGLAVGASRGWTDPEQSVTPPATVVPVAAVAPAADLASRAELSQMEQRLKAEVSRLRTATPAAAPAAADDEEIMRKVQALIEQSEERQRREFTIRSVELARDFETQRRVDLASVRETVGQLQGVTGAEIRQQREAIDRINNFIRVSQQGR